MKTTKRRLRRIIKEASLLRESTVPAEEFGHEAYDNAARNAEFSDQAYDHAARDKEFNGQAWEQGRRDADVDDLDYDRYDADTSYAAGADSLDQDVDIDTRFEGVQSMKTTKRQLRRIIKEGYNSMSSAGMAMAKRAKRQFAKDYPEIQVGIDGREGWITVNGKKAVNMSQASGQPLKMDDVVDEMKKAYLGHQVQEGKAMKITKNQLKKIIKEEKRKLLNEGVRISDIFAQAAAALSARDGDAIESLARSIDGLMMDPGDVAAYRQALEAMAEAAYELEQHEEEGY